VINTPNSLRRALIGHSWGIKALTGYPVMVIIVDVAEIIVQATFPLLEERKVNKDIELIACIMEGRNNEMIDLIAKYFL
jgi:hypothetical protein